MPETAVVHLFVAHSVAEKPEVDWVPDIGEERDRAVLLDKVWIEPLTGTLMLAPKQISQYSTVTGDMARLRKTAGYTVPTAAAWEDAEVGFAGNWFLLSKDNPTEEVETSETYAADQAFFVALFLFGSGGGKVRQVASLKFGQYELKVRSDGYTALYEGSTFKGAGYLVGERNKTSPAEGYLPWAYGDQALYGNWLRLLILPFNRYQIAFIPLDNLGGGWVYSDTSRDNKSAWGITTSAPFKFSFPDTQEAQKGLIQVMPVVYEASGSFITATKVLPHKPSIAPDKTSAYDAPAGTGGTVTVVDESNNEITTWNGTKDRVRAKVALTGAPANTRLTIFYYRTQIRWAVERTAVVPSEIVLNPPNDYDNLTFNAGESDLAAQAGNTIAFVPRKTDVMKSLSGKSYRGVTVADPTEGELFAGFIDPAVDLGRPGSQEVVDMQAQSVAARDFWALLEKTVIPDDWIMDGLYHYDVVKRLFALSGIPDLRMDVDTAGVGDWNGQFDCDWRYKRLCFLVKGGTTAGEAARSIRDNFSNWILDCAPVGGVYKARYKSRGVPAPPPAPVRTLYRSMVDHGWQNSFWGDFREWRDPVQANHIQVIGATIHGVTIESVFEDADSQSPETPEANRNEFWVGKKLSLIKRNENLTTQEICDAVKECLKARLYNPRKMARWTAMWDALVQVGSYLRLEGKGLYRILSAVPVAGKDDKIGEPATRDTKTDPKVGQHTYRRVMTYVGERIGD
jgi:hypothetical protein